MVRKSGHPVGDGDWKRLLELLTPVHAQTAGLARRLAGSAADGDELFQEAVLRAFAALPSLRDESRFRPWFQTILIRAHRSRSRRSFWRRFLPLETSAGVRLESAVEESAADAERDQAGRVARALASLPAEQREAVVLFELEGMSVEEIAEIQQVSASAVKSRLSRARARLRRIYERWGFGRTRSASCAATERTGGPARRSPAKGETS